MKMLLHIVNDGILAITAELRTSSYFDYVYKNAFTFSVNHLLPGINHFILSNYCHNSVPIHRLVFTGQTNELAPWKWTNCLSSWSGHRYSTYTYLYANNCIPSHIVLSIWTKCNNDWCLSLIRKSKDYVSDIWVYKVLGIWKCYYRVKKH